MYSLVAFGGLGGLNRMIPLSWIETELYHGV
jgi:hypothetical protein